MIYKKNGRLAKSTAGSPIMAPHTTPQSSQASSFGGTLYQAASTQAEPFTAYGFGSFGGNLNEVAEDASTYSHGGNFQEGFYLIAHREGDSQDINTVTSKEKASANTYKKWGLKNYFQNSIDAFARIPNDLTKLTNDFVKDPVGTLESLGPSLAGLGMAVPITRVTVWNPIERNSPGHLIATDTLGSRPLRKLVKDIRTNGLQNPVINYVRNGGKNYVVFGNNRLAAARHLGITSQLRYQQVKLPFRGYKTPADLIPVKPTRIYSNR